MNVHDSDVCAFFSESSDSRDRNTTSLCTCCICCHRQNDKSRSRSGSPWPSQVSTLMVSEENVLYTRGLAVERVQTVLLCLFQADRNTLVPSWAERTEPCRRSAVVTENAVKIHFLTWRCYAAVILVVCSRKMCVSGNECKFKYMKLATVFQIGCRSLACVHGLAHFIRPRHHQHLPMHCDSRSRKDRSIDRQML